MTSPSVSGAEIAWKVEIHDGIEPVESAWRVLACSQNSTPFQTFAFMRLFYRQLAVNTQAEPVVALVRHSDGSPAALFPMMRSRRHGLNWLHSDARPIDYCAPIFDGALSQETVRNVIDAMLACVPRADLVYFNRMPAHFCGSPNAVIGLPNAHRLRLSAWVLPLAGRSPEELKAAEHANFRNSMRRRRRNLAKAHHRVFRIAIGDEITAADLAVFREMRVQSAIEKERSNILEDPDWADLYTALGTGQAAPCLPWLASLTADGEVIAVLFGITDGRRPLAILPASKLGYWKPLAPGLQLFEECILYFRDTGAELLDMSIGDMAYKIRLGCDELPLYDAVFPRSWRGRAYYLFWRVKVALRSRMRKISDE